MELTMLVNEPECSKSSQKPHICSKLFFKRKKPSEKKFLREYARCSWLVGGGVISFIHRRRNENDER